MKKSLFYLIKDLVLSEIGRTLSSVSCNEVEEFMDALVKADKVFLIGAGRVMLMSQAFAKRINHLGIKVYIVGETTTPAGTRKSILVACSSSGETASVVTIAKVAKKHNLKIVVVTARKESTLAKLSDLCVVIPTPTKLRFTAGESSVAESKQPLGNLFEQSLLIFFDSIAILMRKKLGISEKEMWRFHTNLE